MLDDLHVAAPNTLKVTDAVRRFIETVVSSADSVAVVVTSGAGGGQDFTADRRLVLKAIDRFRGQKLRSATVERLNDVSLNLGGVLSPNPDPLWPDRDNRARIALETLQKTADALAPLEDRRPMLLWVSEGPEYEANERTNTNQSSPWSISRSMRAAIERLNRVNAVVFAIDPRGVSAGNADQIQTSSIFSRRTWARWPCRTRTCGPSVWCKRLRRTPAVSRCCGVPTCLPTSAASSLPTSPITSLATTRRGQPREVPRHRGACAAKGRAGACENRSGISCRAVSPATPAPPGHMTTAARIDPRVVGEPAIERVGLHTKRGLDGRTQPGRIRSANRRRRTPSSPDCERRSRRALSPERLIVREPLGMRHAAAEDRARGSFDLAVVPLARLMRRQPFHQPRLPGPCRRSDSNMK